MQSDLFDPQPGANPGQKSALPRVAGVITQGTQGTPGSPGKPGATWGRQGVPGHGVSGQTQGAGAAPISEKGQPDARSRHDGESRRAGVPMRGDAPASGTARPNLDLPVDRRLPGVRSGVRTGDGRGAAAKAQNLPRASGARTSTQELRLKIEALSRELVLATSEQERAEKAAKPTAAAFAVAHELAVKFCQDHGWPPMGPPYAPDLSVRFRALIAERDRASAAHHPFKQARAAAERAVKATLSELKVLNTELEQHERLLG